MIIFDLNQITYASVLGLFYSKNAAGIEVNEDLLRHTILNSIRYNKKKFQEYGEVIIATDNKSWRYKRFKYYKANRVKLREASTLDWKYIHELFNKITTEIKENFPYRLIRVDGAEADDIIGTLVRNTSEKTIIISGDHDFKQLHREGIKQYDPVNKVFVSEPDPKGYLLLHILRGDSGDGIPNVLSDDDTFISSKRQSSLTKKRLNNIDQILLQSEEYRTNFKRNEDLIDLTKTPQEIQTAILEEFNNEVNKPRNKMFNYFVSNKLKILLTDIQDF